MCEILQGSAVLHPTLTSWLTDHSDAAPSPFLSKLLSVLAVCVTVYIYAPQYILHTRFIWCLCYTFTQLRQHFICKDQCLDGFLVYNPFFLLAVAKIPPKSCPRRNQKGATPISNLYWACQFQPLSKENANKRVFCKTLLTELLKLPIQLYHFLAVNEITTY
jgi:hypothetical protein